MSKADLPQYIQQLEKESIKPFYLIDGFTARRIHFYYKFYELKRNMKEHTKTSPAWFQEEIRAIREALTNLVMELSINSGFDEILYSLLAILRTHSENSKIAFFIRIDNRRCAFQLIDSDFINILEYKGQVYLSDLNKPIFYIDEDDDIFICPEDSGGVSYRDQMDLHFEARENKIEWTTGLFGEYLNNLEDFEIYLVAVAYNH